MNNSSLSYNATSRLDPLGLRLSRRKFQASRGTAANRSALSKLLGTILLVGLLLQAKSGQAQGRPPQYQFPTKFDSVYIKRPARMVHFIAWEYYGGGQIEWTTLREDKIVVFVVQYSTDGHTWQEVGQMPAHPGTRAQQNYTQYDAHLERYGAPVVYYRVQEVAKNGHFTYSPVRSIRVGNPATPWRMSAVSPLTGQ